MNYQFLYIGKQADGNGGFLYLYNLECPGHAAHGTTVAVSDIGELLGKAQSFGL